MKFPTVLNFFLMPASILALSVSVSYVRDDDGLTNDEDTIALMDQLDNYIMDSAAICNMPDCDVSEQQSDNPSPLMIELQQPAADSLADSNWEIPEKIPVNEYVYETPQVAYDNEGSVRSKRLPLQSTNWRRDLMPRPLHRRLLLPSLGTRWKRYLVRRLPLLDTRWKRALVKVKRLPPQSVGWVDK